MSRLKAPFPYYGGKGRYAKEVWERLGPLDVYSEPFSGSLAMLLANPHATPQRETACDTNGFICNFYRAIRADPEEVAYWADYPTIHQDLYARHTWLRRWGTEHAERLREDPDWYDAKAAGWWVWGASLWIGGEWCLVNHEKRLQRKISARLRRHIRYVEAAGMGYPGKPVVSVPLQID